MIFTGHNVNNLARIKPTSKGIEILRQVHLEVDTNGWIELPLWEVMEIFGPRMHHGADPVFETNFLLQETPR